MTSHDLPQGLYCSPRTQQFQLGTASLHLSEVLCPTEFRNKLPSLRFGTRLRLREKRRHKFQTWHVHTTLTSRSCGAIRRLRRHESVFIAPAKSMFVLTLHPGRQTAHYRGKLECLNHDNLVVQTFLFSQHECF